MNDQKSYSQVKCEVIEEKTSQGASDARCQTVLTFKCCMCFGGSLSGNVGAGSLEPLISSISLEI